MLPFRKHALSGDSLCPTVIRYHEPPERPLGPPRESQVRLHLCLVPDFYTKETDSTACYR